MGVYDTFTCLLSIKAHLAHLDASIAVFVVFVVVVNDVVVLLLITLLPSSVPLQYQSS